MDEKQPQLESPTESLSRGVSFGKYTLIERLAVGGMAEIFKAKQVGVRGFEKFLVIKRILPHLSEDPEFVAMFEDEAKLAAQLSHANIVQIYDLGEIEGALYIAMEFLDGKNLRDITRQCKNKGLMVSVEMAVFILVEILKGLDYAHRRKDANNRDLGIIHRDVSPQNIFITYEGEVKVLDFGIAKAKTQANKTEAGILKGKFGYMSPEQAAGREINQQTDIYAAGVILWELLTDKRLFTGKTDFEKLERVKKGDILNPSSINPSVPPHLDQIVCKALAKIPSQRYQSSADFQLDLNRFLYSIGSEFTSLTLGIFMKTIFSRELVSDLNPLPTSPLAFDTPVETLSTRLTDRASQIATTSFGNEEVTRSDVNLNEKTLSKSIRISKFQRLPIRRFGLALLIVSAVSLGWLLSRHKPSPQPHVVVQTIPLQIILKTDPEGAFIKNRDDTVLFDKAGTPVRTPYSFPFDPSREGAIEKLTFVLKDHDPLTVDFRLKNGASPEPFKLVRSFGTLILDVKPSDCEIQLNGEPDQPPFDQLTPGSYIVRLSKEGFIDDEFTITLNKGETKKIRRTLKRSAPKPIFYEIQLMTTPPQSDISVNGKPIGRSNEKGEFIFRGAEAGKNYEIAVSKSGFKTSKRLIEKISAKEELRIQLSENSQKPRPAPAKSEAAAGHGLLNIRPPLDIPFVFIRIDSKSEGTAPGPFAKNIRLTAGAHSIVCSAPDRVKTKTHSVKIESNQTLDFICKIE